QIPAVSRQRSNGKPGWQTKLIYPPGTSTRLSTYEWGTNHLAGPAHHPTVSVTTDHQAELAISQAHAREDGSNRRSEHPTRALEKSRREGTEEITATTVTGRLPKLTPLTTHKESAGALGLCPQWAHAPWPERHPHNSNGPTERASADCRPPWGLRPTYPM
ncbi:Hypothetical predicted protein, partial [Pelobates cultripes]